MTLEDQINEDIKSAMKSRDEARVSCLRFLKSNLKNKQVEKLAKLEDEEIHAVISSLIRRSMDSIKEFSQGGREDLAAKEKLEMEILYGYLPKQLSPEDVEKIIRETISELSAEGPKDIGRVMKAAMNRLSGQAQGKEVNEIAKRLLTQAS
jgi:uncharacterized protein